MIYGGEGACIGTPPIFPHAPGSIPPRLIGGRSPVICKVMVGMFVVEILYVRCRTVGLVDP